MKALALLAIPAALLVAGAGFMVATLVAVATHPWLAVGFFLPPPPGAPTVTARDTIGLPVVGGVPAGQWPLITAAAKQSACGVAVEDLAAIAKIESDFGRNPATHTPHNGGIVGYGQFDPATWKAYGSGDIYNPADALPAIARLLCARGYGRDRVATLNSFGGCTTPLCLGTTDYATAITNLGQTFRADTGVVAIARSWVTKPPIPYVFGGNTRGGVDCSGLVVAVLNQVGVHVPRTAAAQYDVSQHISTAEVQPGDLVFFSNTYMPGVSHVGVYVGNGMMVNAEDERVGVIEAPIFDGAYWQAHFTGFGRIRVR